MLLFTGGFKYKKVASYSTQPSLIRPTILDYQGLTKTDHPWLLVCQFPSRHPAHLGFLGQYRPSRSWWGLGHLHCSPYWCLNFPGKGSVRMSVAFDSWEEPLADQAFLTPYCWFEKELVWEMCGYLGYPTHWAASPGAWCRCACSPVLVGFC